MCKLPEGYKRLEYIQYNPEALYEISGFVSYEDAVELIRELSSVYQSNKYDIKVKGHIVPDEFSVIIPKGALEYLEEKKRLSVVEFIPDIQVESFSPRLHRFMEEKYINEFFENGTLFISSFKRCKSLENQYRKDQSEGKATVSGFDGNYTVEMVAAVPDDAFLLCTSLSENNIMPDGTENKYCLEILNLEKFIDLITYALVENGYKINRVLCGPCNYGERLITNDTIDLDLQDLLPKKGSNTMDFEKLFSLPSIIAGDGMYFRKELEKAFEHEYRIIWCIGNCDDDHIIIKAPDAARCCQKKRI